MSGDKMEKISIFEKLLKKASLHTRIKVPLEMAHLNLMIVPDRCCTDEEADAACKWATEMADRLIEAECPLPAFINAGTELEYFKPIRLGDTITTVAKLVDLTEKEGRNGKLLFMTVEVTYTNQDNELVVKCTNNFVRR